MQVCVCFASVWLRSWADGNFPKDDDAYVVSVSRRKGKFDLKFYCPVIFDSFGSDYFLENLSAAGSIMSCFSLTLS